MAWGQWAASDRILCYEGPWPEADGQLDIEYLTAKDHGQGLMGLLEIEYFATKDHGLGLTDRLNRILCY